MDTFRTECRSKTRSRCAGKTRMNTSSARCARWVCMSKRCWRYRKKARLRSIMEITSPIVIGRDHLDSGSVASPNRETEGMLDGSDAIADWPLLNALINTAAGASWISIHNGGGVGIGFSQHAGMVVVADGTENSKRRLERVLTSDPGTGILRHADAGYSRAIEFAAANKIDIPMKLQNRD